MSDTTPNPNERDPQEREPDPALDTAEQEQGQPVGKLMGDPTPDLEAEAEAAAREAAGLVEEVAALQSGTGAAAPPPAAAPARAASSGPSRERLLKGVLLANLILMGVVLALPDPAPQQDGPGRTASAQRNPGQPAAEGPGPANPATQSPAQVSDGAIQEPGQVDPLLGTRTILKGLSDNGLWILALGHSDRGEYDAAVALLLSLEAQLRERLPAAMASDRIERNHIEGLLVQVRQTLSWNLRHAGRFEEAMAWSRKVQAYLDTDFLPQDYLRMAEQAEEVGDANDMRRNYARFLLSQKLHDTQQFKRVPEAYLKLGNSYRLEAMRGEDPGAQAPGRTGATGGGDRGNEGGQGQR